MDEDEFGPVAAAPAGEDEFGPVTPTPAKPKPKHEAEVSKAEAVGRGFVQGGTMGWGDEIQGGMESGINALAKAFGLAHAPEVERSNRDGTADTRSVYERSRDEERVKNARAEEDHSKLYGAGQFAGGMVIPGGAGTGVLKQVGRAALEGAVNSLGEADEMSAEDAAYGAATGVGGYALFGGLGRGLRRWGARKGKLLAKQDAKEVAAAGIRPKDLADHATNETEQAAAQRAAGIGKKKWGFLPASTEEIQEQASQAATKAGDERKVLEDEFAKKGVKARGQQVGLGLRHRAKEIGGPKGYGKKLVRPGQAKPPALPASAETPPLASTRAGGRKAAPPEQGTVPDVVDPALANTVVAPNPYKYHATPEGNVDLIRAEGLSPRHGGKNYDLKKNKGRVFFSPENQAEHWKQNLEGFSGQPAAQLRTRRSVAPVQGANKDIFVRDKTVPPQDLEIRGPDGQWGPLVNRDLQRASTPENLKLTPLPDLPPPQPKLVKDGPPLRDPETEPMRRALLKRARYFEGVGEQPFRVLNERRKQYGGRAKFGSDSPSAAVRQDVHRELNSELASAADRAIPGQGSKWRQLGQDQRAAILAQEGTERALQNEAQRVPGQIRMRDLVSGAVGAGVGGFKGAALGYAASKFMQNRGQSAAAMGYAARAKLAGGAGTLSKAFTNPRRVGSALARSLQNVQSAENEEEAAQKHYVEAMTNPEYNKHTHTTEEK